MEGLIDTIIQAGLSGLLMGIGVLIYRALASRKKKKEEERIAKQKEEQQNREEGHGYIVLVVMLLIATVVAYFFVSGQENSTVKPNSNNGTTTYSRQQTKTTTIADYYQQNYPMVWGYIEKNTAFPEDYIEFYHDVWGDLQKYTGDGINFRTLTKREQMLVDYPTIGSYIFFSSANSREYHSTYKCYTLLKSNPIAKKSSLAYMYSPCSKCVGE